MTATTTSRHYPGFSRRFNELLDKAEYPPLDYGRARALADEFGVSKSGARKWIRENTPPRAAMLRLITEKLYKKTRLNSLRNTSKAIAWMQYGDEIEGSPSEQNILQADHIMLSNIYVAVHICARSMEFDLESLPRKTLDRLYNTVIEQTLKQDSAEPDKKLIESLLVLARG